MKARITSLICGLAAALMIANSTDATNDVIPLIRMEEVPLPDAIKTLAQQAKVNIIIDPHITGFGTIGSSPYVTASWTNLTAETVLNRLIRVYKLTMVTNPVTTVTRVAPANLGVKPVPASQVGAETGTVIPLITMSYVPLTDAISNLGKQSGLNITFDPRMTDPEVDRGTVSFRWTNITGRQALAAVLDNYGLTMTEDAATATARVSLRKSGAE